MITENETELHVAPPKGMQHATFEDLDATGDATPAQPASLKALANKVLTRNKQCNIDATAHEKPCNKPPEKHPQKLHDKSLPIHRVLVQLRDIRPYRILGAIAWRGDPTSEQYKLLQDYEAELVEALTPRSLTNREAENIALWLHDIGEDNRQERDYIFSQATLSPKDRIAYLWMADGSPD